jgi:hypothetical protein
MSTKCILENGQESGIEWKHKNYLVFIIKFLERGMVSTEFGEDLSGFFRQHLGRCDRFFLECRNPTLIIIEPKSQFLEFLHRCLKVAGTPYLQTVGDKNQRSGTN